MKIFILVINLLLFCSSSYSQSTNELEKEVLIVFFDKDQRPPSNYRNHTRKSKKSKERDGYIYTIFLNKADNIKLSFREYADFDELERGNPDLFFKVNKSFLRKNKDIILTQKKMLKLGYQKTYTLFNDSKHILLINKSDIKNKPVFLRSLLFSFN